MPWIKITHYGSKLGDWGDVVEVDDATANDLIKVQGALAASKPKGTTAKPPERPATKSPAKKPAKSES